MNKMLVSLTFVSLSIISLIIACGNHEFSDEKNKVTQADADKADSGLQLVVKNALPEQQINSNRVRPHLNAFFCYPMPTGDGPTPKSEDRCVRLAGVINNGTTESFLVSKADLAKISHKGNGKGSFEFNDNHSSTSIPWPCYQPNDKVSLDSNHDNKQVWHVEVNQRYSLSYGCLIDKR